MKSDVWWPGGYVALWVVGCVAFAAEIRINYTGLLVFWKNDVALLLFCRVRKVKLEAPFKPEEEP